MIGAGPPAITARGLQKQFGTAPIDMIDRRPVPYGPDPSGRTRPPVDQGRLQTYERPPFRQRPFWHVTSGRTSPRELIELYDAVPRRAPDDRRSAWGEDLTGVIGRRIRAGNGPRIRRPRSAARRRRRGGDRQWQCRPGRRPHPAKTARSSKARHRRTRVDAPTPSTAPARARRAEPPDRDDPRSWAVGHSKRRREGRPRRFPPETTTFSDPACQVRHNLPLPETPQDKDKRSTRFLPCRGARGRGRSSGDRRADQVNRDRASAPASSTRSNAD